jgi:hypothetical protein
MVAENFLDAQCSRGWWLRAAWLGAVRDRSPPRLSSGSAWPCQVAAAVIERKLHSDELAGSAAVGGDLSAGSLRVTAAEVVGLL